jgi:exonuclease III
MGTNHGGVLFAAVPGIRLSSITSATVAITAATTFEAVCVRVWTGSFNCVVLAIYRPGSEAVTASFCDELADVLGRIAVMREPIFVAGDVNIRLDRPDDQNTCHLHA